MYILIPFVVFAITLVITGILIAEYNEWQERKTQKKYQAMIKFRRKPLGKISQQSLDNINKLYAELQEAKQSN